MKAKLIKEDKKYFYIELYFDLGKWDWHKIKLKIPKRKLVKL